MPPGRWRRPQTQFKPNQPPITIQETNPVFVNWPRDCSLLHDYKVILNLNAAKRQEIFDWLEANNIKCTKIGSGAFVLYDDDSLVLFKLTWGYDDKSNP